MSLQSQNRFVNRVGGESVHCQLTLLMETVLFKQPHTYIIKIKNTGQQNNARLIHKIPLHDVKIGVWCAVSATRIIRPIIFSDALY